MLSELQLIYNSTLYLHQVEGLQKTACMQMTESKYIRITDYTALD